MRRSRRLAFGTTVGVAGSSSAMPLASLTPQTMVVSSPTGAPARLQRSSGTNRSGVVTGGASWCGGEPARSGAAACCLDLETAAVGTVPSILLLWRNSGLRRRCRSATRTLRLSWPGLCSFGRISDSAMLSAAMCSGPVASRQSRSRLLRRKQQAAVPSARPWSCCRVARKQPLSAMSFGRAAPPGARRTMRRHE
jgi:hypothetical protein